MGKIDELLEKMLTLKRQFRGSQSNGAIIYKLNVFGMHVTGNEARLLVMDETGNTGYRVISWGKVEVNPISKCAYYVYGGD